MASIADLFFKALLDDHQLQLDAEKSGTKAGETMGSRMANGISLKLRAGLAVISAGAAIATKGLVELDDITAQYTADTGATAAEADKARAAILAMSARNIQPMREIGQVLATVHTDMGLTGDAANATAESFLRFARVTGRDAVEEVKSFDDLLDAWNLTASDAQGIMDKLTVSHQKYGGSVAADEEALKRLAPAMKALNFNVDDTIALLDLFKTKGLDAADTTKAFNSAVAKLPKGTNLKDFIAKLSQIKDPAERARKAVEVFGSKGGIALANALGPGIGALDDYRITTQEATGATDKARDAIDGTFNNRVQLAIKGVTAEVIKFFDQFGPGLTGAASLASLGGALGLDKFVSQFVAKLAEAGKSGGEALIDAIGTATGAAGTVIGNLIAKAVDPTESLLGNPLRRAGAAAGALWSRMFAVGAKVADVLASIFVKLPGVPALRSAILAASIEYGTFSGTAAGTAAGLAFKLALVAGVVLAWKAVIDTYNQQREGLGNVAKSFGGDIANQIVGGTTEQLQQSKAALQKGIEDIMKTGAPGLAIDALTTMKDQIDAIDAELDRRANGGLPLQMLSTGEPAFTAAFQNAGDVLKQTIDWLFRVADAQKVAFAPDIQGAIRQSANILTKGLDEEAASANNAASAITGYRTAVEDAFKGVEDAALDKEATNLKLMQNEKELEDVLKSLTKGGTKEQVAEWKLRAHQIEAEDLELKFHLAEIGTDTQKEVALRALLTGKDMEKGLTSKNAETRKRWKALQADIVAELRQIQLRGGPAAAAAARDIAQYLNTRNSASPLHNMRLWGVRALQAYVNGLTTVTSFQEAQVTNALNRLGYKFVASSPPGPGSPLHLIDVWGERTGQAYTGGIAEGIGAGVQRIQSAVASLAGSFSIATPAFAAPDHAVGLARATQMASTHAAFGLATAGSHVGPISISVDARGQANPAAVGAAVKQGVGDAMADVLRDQTMRTVGRRLTP